MNSLLGFFASGILLVSGSAAVQRHIPAITAGDVRYLAMRIASDHPGMVNPKDPAFSRHARNSKAVALDEAAKAKTQDDYRRILTAYVESFDDPHVSIDLPDTSASTNAQNASTTQFKKARFQRLSAEVARVDIPTFYAGDPAFDSVVDAIAVTQKELQRHMPKILIIDLRDNGGGASQPGDQLLAAVWGPRAPAALNNRRPTSSAWRVSPYVLHDLEQRRTRVAEHYPTELVEFDGLLAGLRTALGKKQVLYEEPLPKPKSSGKFMHGPEKVYVITNSACISACMDFMDRVLEAPHVIQVGQPTGWDTLYTEVESVPLPSGLGTATIPVQLLQGRQRSSRQAYQPKIQLGSNVAVDAWVAKLTTEIADSAR